MSKRPDLRHERRLWKSGLSAVAGVDEAGVGPMAGPVVAAAVIFAPETFIKGVHDSKQLTPEARVRSLVRLEWWKDDEIGWLRLQKPLYLGQRVFWLRRVAIDDDTCCRR